MRARGDSYDEMLHLLDPFTADRMLRGELGPDDAPQGYGEVVHLLHEMRSTPSVGDPDPVLLAAMVDAVDASRPCERTPEERPRMSLIAKIGIAAGALTLGGVGAAAADVLPDPAQRGVASAVEALTPFELPDAASDVARDATGESDGEPGVDGPAVADDARDDHQPGTPGASDAPEDPAGEADDFGTSVADDATGESDGEPGVDGPTTADTARETFQPDVPENGGDEDGASVVDPADPPTSEEDGLEVADGASGGASSGGPGPRP